ncbi:MAG: RusA family crossover junction endodeoxyribonuclease [Xanthobacteraceae bacterium]|nr:RusA family crossover junction endodeoxyribonuclease [Xanthobacteraceae bacterium]
MRRVADFAEQFTCQLPVPPSLNNIYRNAGKRRIKTKEYEAWCLECDWELARLKPPAFSLGRVDVSIYLAMPRRPSDIDNRIKPLMDSLQRCEVIRGDDNRFVRSVRAAWSEEESKCRLHIYYAPALEKREAA